MTGIHCERGRICVGQAGSRQAASHVASRESGRNVKEGLTGKYEVTQRAYGGQWIDWNKVRILRIGTYGVFDGSSQPV